MIIDPPEPANLFKRPSIRQRLAERWERMRFKWHWRKIDIERINDLLRVYKPRCRFCNWSVWESTMFLNGTYNSLTRIDKCHEDMIGDRREILVDPRFDDSMRVLAKAISLRAYNSFDSFGGFSKNVPEADTPVAKMVRAQQRPNFRMFCLK